LPRYQSRHAISKEGDTQSAGTNYRSLKAPRSRRQSRARRPEQFWRSPASERTADFERRGQRARIRRPSLLTIVAAVCLVGALSIAGFLIHKYVSASLLNDNAFKAAGFDLEAIQDVTSADFALNDLAINWNALREINADIVGWVVIPDTRVNYPVVLAADNDFYLDHLFDKTSSDAGAIFLDYENDRKIAGSNNIIYGHNLLDGSMFAGLKLYQERDFFDAHRTILLATPEMNYQLEVVAALVCDAEDEIRQVNFTDKPQYEEYVRMLMEYAVINELGEGEIPDNLYCFVTCTDANYSKRTMVCARVVESGQPKGK
jgi:sortase B